MSKNKKQIFVGVATALVTPFLEDGIDYRSLGEIIDFQIENSIDALVIAGTTGEASTLTEREYEELLDFSAEKISGRVPFIVGSGSNDTAKSVRLSKIAEKRGADACLVVTPYYNKATNNGLVENYKEICKNITLPVIVYNVPTRTCVNISPKIYKELSKIENIVAVKEAGSDVGALAELIFDSGDDLDIYTGSDDLIIPLLSLGGSGAISVVSNVLPFEIQYLCKSYISGDIVKAKEIFKNYYKLIRSMFCEVNPIPVKTALSLMGKCREEFRLPLCRMSEENRQRLESIMQDVGLI